MKLYHGSNVKVTQIDLSKSKKGKDFGRGFYLSADIVQAKELSERKVDQYKFGEPTISEFEFDEAMIDQLNLKVLRFTEYTRDWADFILMNRRNRQFVLAHDYDIVIGPIADDRVGVQIRRYMSGLIDAEHFIQELKFMKGVTYQYFFATERAVKLLRPIE